MPSLQPFRLQPVLVERPWGGSRLVDRADGPAPDGPIGESWAVCDLPQKVAPHVDDPSSGVLDGPFAGARLRTVMADARDALMGPVEATSEGCFPLLFKLLDAREHLSVQVHPHEGYVAEHPEARLKTESWYILDAEPGTALYLDVTDGTTAADVDAVMGTPDIVPLLKGQPAVPGAFHHLPAGLVHALGAGALVAEVQTPSDTTFRIYDWAEEYGRAPRQLHPREAMASIRVRPDEAFSLPPDSDVGSRELVKTEHYWMREHRLAEHAAPLAETPGPIVLHVVRGAITLGGLELPARTTAIVPAVSDVAEMAGRRAVVLELGFPA